MDKNKFVAYSLFSGAGGLCIGVKNAGFEIAVATDVNEAAKETYEYNWPEIPFLCSDIRKINAYDLLEKAGGRKPDIIFGGPPCQGFSTLGAKNSCDVRNTLFKEFIRIVRDLKPKAVLIENVQSLTTMYQGQYKNEIIASLEELGYKVYMKVLDSADYGVPQFRKRVFFIASSLDYPFSFPEPTHGENALFPYEKAGDWIMDLAAQDEKFPNHIILNHSDTVIARYRLIPEGGKLPPIDKLPIEIRRKNFGNTYKRLDRNKPSLTMVPGNNAFPVHPTLNRSLTPREAARLQTFPDAVIFKGDRRMQCILIGNAVPVKLGKVVAEKIYKHLIGGEDIEDMESRVYSAPTDSVAQKSSVKNITVKNQISQGFIDLFSGAGGFRIGLERAGWNHLLAVDLDDNVAKTHEANGFNDKFKQMDLSRDESKREIIDRFKGTGVGLVVGGPPCQGFSIFGKRRFVNTSGYDPHKDPRNKLVFSYVDIVREIKPRWFVMENVPGLVNLDNGFFIKELLSDFKKAGYNNIEARILNAAEYGVPQLRKRLIIIGNRTGHIIPWPKKKYFENPKDWQQGYRTVGEAISDLATDESLNTHTCHVPMNHKPLMIERYSHIPEGGKLNPEKLPEHLQKGYRTKEVKNYSHVYKRLHRNKPAITMVPGHNAFPVHPWLNRTLTVREVARIQTFPDDLIFMGSRQNQCIQVGNAFPPLLAEAIGHNIIRAEKNGWIPEEVPTSVYYALVEQNDTKNTISDTNSQLDFIKEIYSESRHLRSVGCS